MHARLSEICNSSKMNIKKWVMLGQLCLSVKQKYVVFGKSCILLNI